LTTVDTPQLSLVETGAPSTTLLTTHRPTSVLVNTFAGPVIVGGSVSLTITSKEQLVVPQSLDAVQLTVLVPTANAWGDVMTVAPILHSKLPVKVGLNVTSAEHSPASLVVVALTTGWRDRISLESG
jgi:hypothetical protein